MRKNILEEHEVYGSWLVFHYSLTLLFLHKLPSPGTDHQPSRQGLYQVAAFSIYLVLVLTTHWRQILISVCWLGTHLTLHEIRLKLFMLLQEFKGNVISYLKGRGSASGQRSWTFLSELSRQFQWTLQSANANDQVWQLSNNRFIIWGLDYSCNKMKW